MILARLGAELWLSRLNRRHVLAHASTVPEAFKDIIAEPTYAKSVQYTLAKSRFGQIEDIYRAAVLLRRAVQRRVAVGLRRVRALARRVGLGDGGVFVCCRGGDFTAGLPLGLV